MQNNVIVDVDQRFCSLLVIIIDDEVIFIAIRVKKSRFDFVYLSMHHGSRFETLTSCFFLLMSFHNTKIDEVE
jgi:hypothetical protein